MSFGHGIFFVPNGQRSPAIDDRECLIKGFMQTSFWRAGLSGTARCLGIEVDDALSISEQMGRLIVEARQAVGPYLPIKPPNLRSSGETVSRSDVERYLVAVEAEQ
ncbi:hypothetical protein CQ14_29420 [Bradyrhizobium lablabi]|uniref:Uncharacterized protein n=1 Tax=Bradyrhizobium lablabi TaxID=722472 RepID=A0A0R3N6D9_9BRAD|nr:hypothetical protein [Bradyrhizobium lablabi]KRR27755.1 hypothetical protein CQ14_29420 [Bradyrhizobium lablabi]